MPQLVVHGGAGSPPEAERPQRQRAVEAALDRGWSALVEGALEAVVTAVRHMEDEPLLNAGIGASTNLDGSVELDAGLMEGTGLRVGSVAAVRDIRHPIEGARAVMDDGRHVLLAGAGASRLSAARGVELCDPATFLTPGRPPAGDTVGAVARDRDGRIAVAVSTGGTPRKLPGRVGDSPLVGCGFYAYDRLGGACATGLGEAFMRLVLCHQAVMEMAGAPASEVAGRLIQELARRVGGSGGLILVDARGGVGAAWNTPFMPWAERTSS
jgi:beta-aspartyl-peptidase (threonine type)